MKIATKKQQGVKENRYVFHKSKQWRKPYTYFIQFTLFKYQTSIQIIDRAEETAFYILQHKLETYTIDSWKCSRVITCIGLQS